MKGVNPRLRSVLWRNVDIFKWPSLFRSCELIVINGARAAPSLYTHTTDVPSYLRNGRKCAYIYMCDRRLIGL